jgi:hypothetical protein
MHRPARAVSAHRVGGGRVVVVVVVVVVAAALLLLLVVFKITVETVDCVL